MLADNVEAVIDLAAQIQEGVFNVFDDAELLLDDDGDGDVRGIDKPKLRLAIYEHVIEARVQTKADRRAKAITKGALTLLVLPNADDDASDDVGRKVYDELMRLVWNETNPNQTGFIQNLVGEVTDDNGLGYVLVRTKVSVKGNPMDAVYVTSDFDRIAEDFTSPLGAAVTRAAKKYATNASMLIRRGQDAKKVRRGLDSAMNHATVLAASTVDLALPRGDE
jgi:hypothetical protein